MSIVRDMIFAAGVILIVAGGTTVNRMTFVGVGIIASAALWSIPEGWRELKDRRK